MTQGRRSAGVLVLVVALFAAVQVAMAAQYTIGGNTVGWNFAPSQNFYNDWASKIKFAVGDTLVFQYMPAAHNVLEVNSADYSSCTVTNPMQTYGTGSDVVSLTTAGTSYFICGFLGHCSGYGMLMKVVVGGAGSAPTPPPASALPPPPQAVLPPPPKATPPPASPPPAPANPPPTPPPKLSPPPATIPPHTKAPAASPKVTPAPAPSAPTPTSGTGTPLGVNAPAPSPGAPGSPGSPGSTPTSSGEVLHVGVSFVVATISVACVALLV